MAIEIDKNKKNYQIKNGYVISLTIGDYEYESDITAIRIVNSLSSSYPIYIIKLNLRPAEIIKNKVFGQDIIKLSIKHIDFDNKEKDNPYNVLLLFLSGDFDIPQSNKLLTNSNSLQDLAPYTMHCVPYIAFQFMTYTCNFIFRDSTIPDIFSYIYNKSANYIENDLLNILYDYNSPYINTKRIEQLILPPTILKNHFDYLLEEFGLFSNWGCIFASVAEDKPNKININAMDIGYQYESGENIFNLKQIAIDTEDSDVDSYGYDNFYITNPIHTKYVANTTIGNIGNNIRMIHKPIDKFIRIGNSELNSVYTSNDEILMNELNVLYGLPNFCSFDLSKKNEIFISETLSDRVKYNIDHICHYRDEKNEDTPQDLPWLQSGISKQIMNFSQLSCKLEKHIPIFKFTNIGKMVTFSSETAEYLPYNGKYILYSSDMLFKRSKVWEMTVDLKIIRPKWSMVNA